MVDSHIITGKCFQTASKILKLKRKKLKIKDIKCAVMHDLRGFADFVAERYSVPKKKLGQIDLKIINILLSNEQKMGQELKKLIEALEKKNKERSRELEKERKLTEVHREIAEERAKRLERFYSLIVGNELKIARLKEKVRELKEKVLKKK